MPRLLVGALVATLSILPKAHAEEELAIEPMESVVEPQFCWCVIWEPLEEGGRICVQWYCTDYDPSPI